MLNKVILMGRLTKDPEFRQTPSGVPVCRISIAISRQYTNKQTGEKVDDATFVECVAWRYTAEFISRYFTKGRMILVEGSLKNDNYTDNNGVKHYRMNVVIDNASFCGDSPRNGNGQGGGNAYGGNGDYSPFPEEEPSFGAPSGGYDSRQNGGNYQRPQGGYNQPPQQSAPQNNQPAKSNLSIGNLSEFEDILSDGELPF
ncbi:MAG: single-stranded DNA-binding protein [Oscillospiraceae bacterium]|nr:single-stranded DNA-binding protein [Oscillospiraceae bacterium]